MTSPKAPDPFGPRHMLAPFLALFTSAGTLICCALPAVMVSLGMGAALAGLVTDFPQLVWLSQHKGAVFGVSAVMIALAGFIMWHARNLPCPIDPRQAKACNALRRASWGIWGFSVFAFTTGAFFAFVAPLILEK